MNQVVVVNLIPIKYIFVHSILDIKIVLSDLQNSKLFLCHVFSPYSEACMETFKPRTQSCEDEYCLFIVLNISFCSGV